jgi:predicted RNA-binding protein YlxR (DUF448 family)
MVRVVLVAPPGAESGPASVVVDAKGGSFGRGAHVHPTAACVDKAAKRGFSRAFKREVRVEAAALIAGIAEAYGKRLEGLLSGGVRGKHVVFGSDEVAETWRAGKVHLMVLAADATSAAARSVVKQATGEGKVLVFGDKLRLARTLGRRPGQEREGIGVCAVTDAGLAAAIREAWLCAVGLARQGERQDAGSPGSLADDPRTGSDDNGAAGDARGAEA